MTRLVCTEDDGIATICLNAPARRNILDVPLLQELLAAFTALHRPDVRVAVLRASAGSSVWSAGSDISQLHGGKDPLETDGPLNQLLDCIQSLPIPVIAMVDGSCWGGGSDLALRCDIVVGTMACSFAFTPAKLGLPYTAAGLLNVLLRAGFGKAMEMFSTGLPIQAAEALRIGLLNHLVASTELETFTYGLARRIRDNAPLSIKAAKVQLRALAHHLLEAAGEQTIDARSAALNSEDYREGVAAFTARRTPNFIGR